MYEKIAKFLHNKVETLDICNSLSHFVDIVYSCFLIMYCIVSYCALCLYLICYLYTNVSTKVTRNKDIYIGRITF